MYVSMKGMLQRANEGNYAVMAINCFNIETARAVINAAQELRAPIIVNIVQEHMVNHCDSALIAPIVKLLANRASVEVALNFDHGEDVGLLKKALQDGYSSVMVDASRYDLEGNIRMTREIVDFAKQFDASVEGEIGCMGASGPPAAGRAAGDRSGRSRRHTIRTEREGKAGRAPLPGTGAVRTKEGPALRQVLLFAKGKIRRSGWPGLSGTSPCRLQSGRPKSSPHSRRRS